MAEKNEKEKAVNEQIRDFGQVELELGVNKKKKKKKTREQAGGDKDDKV